MGTVAASASYNLWTDSVATSTGSRAAPTASTEGMDLGGVSGYRVIVSAAAGQTLAGGGNMLAWVFDNTLARWARDPDLDFSLTASGVSWTNVRDRASPDFQVSARSGRVVWQASSVTTSSGEVTTQILAELS